MASATPVVGRALWIPDAKEMVTHRPPVRVYTESGSRVLPSSGSCIMQILRHLCCTVDQAGIARVRSPFLAITQNAPVLDRIAIRVLRHARSVQRRQAASSAWAKIVAIGGAGDACPKDGTLWAPGQRSLPGHHDIR